MNRIAPEGQVWVCLWCRRVGESERACCFLHSRLCYADKLIKSEDGRVVGIQDGGMVEAPKEEI